jgi:5,10-methylenetetrahydromethanopterin reductase
MRIGMFVDLQRVADPWEEIQRTATESEESRLHSLWFQHGMGYDATIMAALASRASRTLDIGLGVFPAPTRHPLSTAQAAVSLQIISGGRFTLGLGASHRQTLKETFGLSRWTPVDGMREHLDELLPAIQGGGKVGISADTPPDVVLGALLPRMLDLAGGRTSGTVTWLTGTETLRTHIVPKISEAAARAGRGAPRVVAVLPVCVTRDVDAARERVDARLDRTSRLPSYRAMLDKEGAKRPSDLALCGGEDEVREAIQRLAASGVTELAAMVLTRDEDERAATRELLSAAAEAS